MRGNRRSNNISFNLYALSLRSTNSSYRSMPFSKSSRMKMRLCFMLMVSTLPIILCWAFGLRKSLDVLSRYEREINLHRPLTYVIPSKGSEHLRRRPGSSRNILYDSDDFDPDDKYVYVPDMKKGQMLFFNSTSVKHGSSFINDMNVVPFKRQRPVTTFAYSFLDPVRGDPHPKVVRHNVPDSDTKAKPKRVF